MFDRSLINTLNTNACLPIMLPMTCYEGSFHEASKSTSILAESATRAFDITTGKGRGAIASFSPTGFGLVSGHDWLEEGVFLALFHDGVKTLGAATTSAKAHLLQNDPGGSNKDLLDTFLLIGDPALRVKVGSACETPTGIELAGFQAEVRGRGVRLIWQTNSEAGILGFNVLRADSAGGEPQEAAFVTINPSLIFAQASGSANGASYAYDDEHVAAGRGYTYRLEIVKLDGSRSLGSSAEVPIRPWWNYLPIVGRTYP